MPTYVYRCKNCGHRFEAWQHMTDEPLTTCPQCQGPINRVYFASGVVFKGSGFYSTDTRPTQALTDSGKSSEDHAPHKSAATETSSGGDSSTSTTPAPASTPSTSTPAK